MESKKNDNLNNEKRIDEKEKKSNGKNNKYS